MKVFKIDSANPKNKSELILNNVAVANDFFTKLFGLIFKRKLKKDEGLLIEYCNSIHTFGMRYSIDVVFLNEDNEIVSIFRKLKPFRITPFIKEAKKVLELRSGICNIFSLEDGNLLHFKEG